VPHAGKVATECCNWNVKAVKSQAKALGEEWTLVFITLSGYFFRKYSQRQATSSGRSGDRDRKRSNASLKFAAISGHIAFRIIEYCNCILAASGRRLGLYC
jgi:hypothetical protein